jgi:peptidoglycan/LPS O-acetylase OafA/YrhL
MNPSHSHLCEGSGASNEFRLGYRPSLDGIRGVSILVVLAFNAQLSFVRGGFIGVDLFFVLSGFLISSLLVQEYHQTSRISLKNFYYRRALRLLPALFALMLFVSVFAAILQQNEKAVTTWKGVIYTILYVANWAQSGPDGAGIGALSHAWSLSVEEQFYLVWPLFLILLLKSRLNRVGISAVLILMIAASIAWSTFLWHEGTNYLRIYFGSDTRASQLLIGCLTALILHWNLVPKTKVVRNVLRLTSIVMVAAFGYVIVTLQSDSGFLYCGGFALIAAGTAALITDVLLFPSPISRVLEFRPLVWLGKVSYGLYLWHFPIFEGSRIG